MENNLWLDWEYRTFAENFSRELKELKKSGTVEIIREKVKYLVSKVCLDQIYYSENSIKVLVPVRFDRRTGYYQWYQEKEIRFPSPVWEIYRVLRALTDRQPWLSRDEYSWSVFLDELILPDNKIKVIEVERELQIYHRSGVEVEYADVSFSGFHQKSIAIKHHSIEKIYQQRTDLGLGMLNNQDYSSILKEYFLRR